MKVTCRFHGELNEFLPPVRRMHEFESRFKGRESIKDKIEALGAPHTEVDVILVNGRSMGFDHILEDGDVIDVYPSAETPVMSGVRHLKHLPMGSPRFIADINIHDVVKMMRALGLDVLEDRTFSFEELIEISVDEGRILLSSSKELLKRKRIVHGIFIWQGNREAQIQKIVDDLSLKRLCKPFSRCLLCNTLLEFVPKEIVWERIPPKTRKRVSEFARCPACDRLYWKGTHYRKIKKKVDRILFPISLKG